MHPSSAWIFNLGAAIYGWFTAQPVWRASCARLAAGLPAHDGIRVADLGCGPGVSTIELARARPDALLVGLDLAPRMLAEASRRRATARHPGRIRWVLGDAARLPFATGSLDALTGHSFLYLLPDRTTALAEMRRVLRSGGRLVLMEPSGRPASVRSILRFSRNPRHLFAVSLWRPFSRVHGRFSPASLAATLEQAGFVGCQVGEALGGLGLLARAEKP
jgi:ubiquinone/menaquinone biosynthesis C-methylase UbiE